MRNSVELRRFSSPHPSLFFWIFGAIFGLKWEGNGGQGLYRVGDPLSPVGGPVPPGGATGPLPPSRDLFANSKKITLGSCRPWLGRQDPVAPYRATGGSFEIFQNGHIFLKFWFFLIYKKKRQVHGPWLDESGLQASSAACSIEDAPASALPFVRFNYALCGQIWTCF